MNLKRLHTLTFFPALFLMSLTARCQTAIETSDITRFWLMYDGYQNHQNYQQSSLNRSNYSRPSGGEKQPLPSREGGGVGRMRSVIVA